MVNPEGRVIWLSGAAVVEQLGVICTSAIPAPMSPAPRTATVFTLNKVSIVGGAMRTGGEAHVQEV